MVKIVTTFMSAYGISVGEHLENLGIFARAFKDLYICSLELSA